MEGRILALRVAAATIIAGGLGSYLFLGRGYFWSFAVLSGLAAGALVYTTFRAYDNLRRLYGRDDDR